MAQKYTKKTSLRKKIEVFLGLNVWILESLMFFLLRVNRLQSVQDCNSNVEACPSWICLSNVSQNRQDPLQRPKPNAEACFFFGGGIRTPIQLARIVVKCGETLQS